MSVEDLINDDYFKIYICPVCQKKFYVPCKEVWVYKIYHNNHYKPVCSWKCLRKYEKNENLSLLSSFKKGVKKNGK